MGRRGENKKNESSPHVNHLLDVLTRVIFVFRNFKQIQLEITDVHILPDPAFLDSSLSWHLEIKDTH